MEVPIDRTQWAESSRRTGSSNYDERATHYEGIRIRCIACETSFVFSPEEQKQFYEVEKRLAFLLPTRCDACRSRLSLLATEDKKFAAQWKANREVLRANAPFLRQWFDVLVELERLGKPRSMQAHVRSLIEQLERLSD